MNLNIGGVNLKLPEIKLPNLNLGNADLKKGVEALKTLAQDMFAPSADGATLFNTEVTCKLGAFDIKLENPVEVLSEKLLGSLSESLKKRGYNPETIGKMLTGNREVTDLGEFELPKLADRATEYLPEVGGGSAKKTETVKARETVEQIEAVEQATGAEQAETAVAGSEVGGSATTTRTASTSLGSGTDFGDQVVDKFSGSISSLDEQINTLMNKGDDLSETEMLKLQQQMQKRSQLFQMMSQIMQMVHDTNKLIIQNLRA